MKRLGKLYVALLAAVVVVTSASISHAFTSKGTSTKKATATLSAPGSVTLNSVTVKKVSDDSTVTDVTWAAANVGAWQVADNYLQLDATTTLNGSGVQIWTNNIAGVAPNQSTLTATERQTVTPAGLVDNSNGKKSISLAWAIRQSNTGITAIDPNANVTGSDSYSWHFTPDKGRLDNPATTTVNEAYVDGADYQTVQSPAGMHYGQAPTEYTGASNPKVIYLEADFRSASTPNTYGTTTLTVEAFQQ
jgi:hypothetical protein